MRIAKILCIVAVAMLCLPGLLVLPAGAEAATPGAQYVMGDIVIGTGYALQDYEFSGAEKFYMMGNITVRSGGTLLVKDTTLAFMSTYNNNISRGRLVDRVFTLTIEDGGVAIFENSTLTTHLIAFSAFPSLGVVVRSKATIIANDSVLAFPGHILLDNATALMRNTKLTAGTENVATYCDPDLFPAALFSSPAVLYQVSSRMEMTNCTLDPFASVPALSDGPHIITVQATDTSGIVGSQTITVIANAGGTAALPPQVEITTPLNGAVLTGTVPVAARVTPSGSIITQVQFFIDGVLNATVTTAPFQFNLDTTALADGEHTITIEATDFDMQAGSQTITIVANAGGTAIIPPQVVITTPRNGMVVTGPTAVNTNVVESGASIRTVEFFVDGVRQSTLLTPPFSFTLNMPSADSGTYVYAYSFLQDTQERRYVTYNLERDLNRTMLVNVAGQSSSNLVRNDTLFYTVAGGQQFRTALFDVGPLTFDRDAVESITLKVLYKTQSLFSDLGTPDSIQITPWLETLPRNTGITITRTSPAYDTSLIYEAQKSAALPVMSSTELRQLSVGYQNTKTDPVLFNRIWVEVKLKAASYGKLNATGGSQITIVNSSLPLNMDGGSYGKMVLNQASNAYLYNVAVTQLPAPGGNSPYWPGNTPNNEYAPSVVQPLRKSSADNTGSPLANLIYQTGASYTVPHDLTMSLDRFDVPVIKSGQIASVRLSVTYTTTPGYVGASYITYKLPSGLARNTGIMVVDSPAANTVSFDLTPVGVDTFDEVRNLTVAFLNGGTQSVYFSRLVLEVQYDPSFYVYRMADMNVFDSLGDPVLGATISSYEYQASPSMLYYTPEGVTSTPPAAVLNYLGRAASDFKTTNYLGNTQIPLLTDVVNGPNTPNARTLAAYRLRVDITNHTGAHYSATTVASFAPFPDLGPEQMTRTINVTIANFVTDKPLLMATNLELSPYPIYEGQSSTLSFRLENRGTAAAYNVLVVMADRYELFNATFAAPVVARIDPGQTIVVTGTYTAPMIAGAHVLSVAVDPYDAVREFNDTSERYLKLDIRVGSLATLQMVPNGLQISPSNPTVNMTSTISVMFQKDGDQVSQPRALIILVQYNDGSRMWLNTTVPSLPAGTQIYFANVDWTPTKLGAYDVTAFMKGIGEEKVSTTVLNYCDLVAATLSFYVNLQPTQQAQIGDLVIIESVVSNAGESAANNFLIRFWLGTIESGTILADVPVVRLNSGQTMMASIDWTAIVRPGERYSNWTITVEVNPFSHPYDHPINETSYANNVIAGVIQVIDIRPYLRLQNVVVQVSGASAQVAGYGQTLSADFTVYNNGSGPSLSTPVSLYLQAADGTTYPYYDTTLDLTAEGSAHVVIPGKPVTQAIGSYTLVIVAQSPLLRPGYNGSAWFTEVFDIVSLVNPNLTVNTLGKTTYKAGDTIVAIVTATTSSGAPLVGLEGTVILLDSKGEQLGPTYSFKTNDAGAFTALLGIPFSYNGAATVNVNLKAGSQTFNRITPITVGTTQPAGIPLWMIILIVVAIVVVVLLVLWRFVLRKGGKEMVECGECGSLIPGDSKKCPNCGIEFDIGKVRCSNCGTYIDQNLPECPECGAKFAKHAPAKEEDEATKQLRTEYDEFINEIRMQAKAALGDKFTEDKFAEWLKTEPEYLPFEQWVARKQERASAPSAKPCPQCGTLNPAAATVCSKCGTQMTAPGGEKEAPKPRTFRRIVRRTDKKEGEEKGDQPKEDQGKEQ